MKSASFHSYVSKKSGGFHISTINIHKATSINNRSHAGLMKPARIHVLFFGPKSWDVRACQQK